MAAADKFVFLIHCQYEKNGYQNRFNIGDNWHTMSVRAGVCEIREKVYADPVRDWQKIKKRLSKYQDILDQFDTAINYSLWLTNTLIISHIAQLLHIKTHIDFDYATSLTSTDRLIDICKENKADTYIAGPSGANYMDLNLFHRAGIKVEFFEAQDKRPILEALRG